MKLNNVSPNYFFRGLPVIRDDGVRGEVTSAHVTPSDGYTLVDVLWEGSNQSGPCETGRLVVDVSDGLGKTWAIVFAASNLSTRGRSTMVEVLTKFQKFSSENHFHDLRDRVDFEKAIVHSQNATYSGYVIRAIQGSPVSQHDYPEKVWRLVCDLFTQIP